MSMAQVCFPRRARLTLGAVAAAALLAAWCGPALAQPSIVNLGTLAGGTSSLGRGLSADGSAAAGSAAMSDGLHPIRWTAGGGLADIGTLAGLSDPNATGISGDGQIVVGYGYHAGQSAYLAFRWTQSGGMQNLGLLTGYPGGTLARGVNGDGSVIAGECQGTLGQAVAFRWTGGTLTGLGSMAPGAFSRGLAVSNNGLVVVGEGSDGTLNRAFRWALGTGMVALTMPPDATRSYATAVSRDGSAIAGVMTRAGQDRAFRWTQADGMVDIGQLPGRIVHLANAISGDGSAVGGASGNPPGSGTTPHAFLWTHRLGIVDLNTYLPTLGVNLTGWTLLSCTAISDDGTALIGDGQFNGQQRAWVVRGLPRPCPADQDGNGLVEPADIAVFVGIWFDSLNAGTLAGDFDGNGHVEPADIGSFVNAWFNAVATGC